MTDAVVYDYASGDRLENRNSYQYSRFSGLDFLNAWTQHRKSVQRRLQDPQSPPAPRQEATLPLTPAFRLLDLIDGLIEDWSAAQVLPSPPSCKKLFLLIKKFEVSKRLYPEYDADFKPVDPTDYRCLELYLRFGELVELACARDSNLVCLNALLKLIDTLISQSRHLSSDQQGRLSWLIAREGNHVLQCAERSGVNI